jgi:hypothetical protein
MIIKDLFNEPKIIGIIGNPNEAKSNLAFWCIEELRKEFKFNLAYFGFRVNLDGKKINSIKELEQIKNSAIFLDEFNSLFDLNDRKKKNIIERTLRLIFHNNNILVLIGVPDNFKKFISGKLDVMFFKKSFYEDMINGSKVKTIINDYIDIDNIKGSSVLNLEKNQTLLYDGKTYKVLDIPYLEKYDTKKDNKEIFKSIKNVGKKC